MLADHQREAAGRAVELLRTRGGLLLADEVGLGKSYVAAETMRRVGGDSELIVPAALVAQWRETLMQFDLAVRVLTHDGIVTDRFMPLVARRLVVVDEAHAFRNPRTQRYAALARRTAGARVLLVTATPVCNSIDDLEALVRLIARDDLLADAGVPSIDAAFAMRDLAAIDVIVSTLIIRRDRSVLPPELLFGELRRSVIRHPVLDAPIIGELRFPLVGAPDKASTHAILRRFLRRRLESSEAALIESLRRQLRFYDRALAAIAAGRSLPKRDYRVAFAADDEREAFQGVLFWEMFAPPGEADPAVIREEIARLQSLVIEAQGSRCEKRAVLVALVADAREPMLIFTGAVATARDLQSVLKNSGLVTSRDRSRDAVLHAFRTGRLDIVVSTDMAAEGLNLQRAGTIVHYDLPWNPVKLDQRNGRAYRIGQTRSSVHAIYFVPQSRDTGILETIARKNRVRRRLLAPHASALANIHPTLPARLTNESAYARLRAATDLALPDVLARRHKAGIEQWMEQMSREYLDQQRLDDLVAVAESEV
ncbi:MAG: DEAD/DEAH box helicase [Acidobacteriota bacterium]|nr:DEAD/DEAH box helicase [Acidobacteriota bacterium]